MPLTARKQDVLRAIEAFAAKHGYPPGVRELGQALGMRSPSTIYRHVEQLEWRGYIRRPKPTILLLTPLGEEVLTLTVPTGKR